MSALAHFLPVFSELYIERGAIEIAAFRSVRFDYKEPYLSLYMLVYANVVKRLGFDVYEQVDDRIPKMETVSCVFSLRLLCDKKSQESESEDDRETWGFLKVMFEDDGTARTKLLTHLGFSLPVEAKDTLQDELSQDVNATGLEEKVADRGYAADNAFLVDNGEDFFNNLPSPKAETPVSNSRNNFTVGDSVPNVEMQNGQEDSADPSFDDAVQQALVVGDYKGAVLQCIYANEEADALVIAHVGGTSLWESTRDQYLKMSHSSYLKVAKTLVFFTLEVAMPFIFSYF
ncbi:hypothetical protein U1Q18_011181 [Sarracenia purpurea var. burkii]